jgi:acetyltransferase-like isoleucine patch superfamily enzyme
MPIYPLRKLNPAADATALYDRWLGELQEALARGDDRWELCRRTLTALWYPGMAGVDPRNFPLAVQASLAQMDARNVTLEPEYYAEVDVERFAERKPLLWMWQMFDRSPLGGNVHLGVHFRRALAPYLFKRVGRNFKCFHFVEFTYGYNLEVGDDVVVHRNVLLDDRGGIVLGNGVSISDYANIYSTRTPSWTSATSATCRRCWATGCASPTTPPCSPGRTWGRTRWWGRWRWPPRTCAPTTSTWASPPSRCG